MANYDVAHVRVQGVDVILIVVGSDFGNKSRTEQLKALSVLQGLANQAGLRGLAALVWDQGGCVASIGPRNWRSFLESLTWPWILANISRKLTVG